MPLLLFQRRVIHTQAQLEALLAALSQEVALIQGPPGTGKVHTLAYATPMVDPENVLSDVLPSFCPSSHASVLSFGHPLRIL